LTSLYYYVAVLGNHDYRGDVLAQLSPILRKFDSRWLCLRSFIVDAGNKTPLFSFSFSFLKATFGDITI